jgi:predicted nucleotidyltransferase
LIEEGIAMFDGSTHTFLTSRTDDVCRLCEKFKVRRLSAFGSVCTESFRETSDIDFLYLFDSERLPLVEYADNYFDFKESLQQLFQRRVDLVPEKTLSNPYFIEEIKKTRVVIYEQSSE